jgi:site-specific DNA-methyltransferase (adenine-specific)
MPDNSVDAIVTDPPYELGFMGKSWDSSGIAYSVDLWTECLRVLKPGGHLLSFGGTRTWHRIAVAIEDAGFDVRDSIAWLYGSGFPKSHNVALGIDKKLGHENRGRAIPVASKFQASDVEEKNKLTSNPVDAYAARSPEAEQWAGWGTALKPAFEPIVVARKPLVGTVAANVLEFGVGGLNIDASRIGTDSITINTFDNGAKPFGDAVGEPYSSRQVQGRWPANIILDEYTAGLLDEQSGMTKSPQNYIAKGGKTNKIYSSGIGVEIGEWHKEYGDSGGASRFFYVAKASKRDRNEGLDGLATRHNGKMMRPGNNTQEKASEGFERFNTQPSQNFHPTVKPTDLMRYLIKLVTPAGGIVLDPFTGSGSTGKAALLDGYQFIGIELTEEYLPIIEGRLKWAVNKVSEDKEKQELQKKEALF